ncbi:hypothetical protein KSF_036850 [Reticulibacter mediterranei]|uniref:DUF3455 domain-containing protein n=1 Tax=Reticulibacter mediterranei TaxID=2778369 RepID=A0A8J3N164_9CHLR|nr:DUF3455 domain-containing protein [Reticulibacter mediterranei]GHO93637.1 hypothetical protein KSF_036850 [Reticulibacter mediterranei]
MKSIGYLPGIKSLLPAMLGLFALIPLFLLTACGGSDAATIQTQGMANASQMASSSHSKDYPDPTNQDKLPESVKVKGDGLTVLLRAPVVEGSQIYECQASTTDASGFAWKFQAPFAFLKADDGTNVIHSTGPAWLYTQDGSIVLAAVGKFTDSTGATVPASATPDAKSIPWLRLDVTEHKGSTGLFSKVEQIQRLYTKGGIAPSFGCNQDDAKHHVTQSVNYTAEYVFWGHK